MIRLRRRNLTWLMTLGLLIAFALFAGVTTPGIQIALLAIFVLAVVASTIELGRERETLLEAIRRAPLRQRISPQAKEAQERARSRGGFVSNTMMLLDVGVIASQSSYEGMAMRRTRSISKDDDAVRPFVTLYIDPEDADRNALIRFEVYNQFGEQQYVHEMRVYLREGEMSVMADHHLPLAGNNQVQGNGDWDVRVYIDGNLVALHNFMLAPSIAERTRRLSSNYYEADDAYDIIDEVPQEMAPSLQELLKGETSRQSASRSPASTTTADGPRRSTPPRRRR